MRTVTNTGTVIRTHTVTNTGTMPIGLHIARYMVRVDGVKTSPMHTLNPGESVEVGNVAERLRRYEQSGLLKIVEAAAPKPKRKRRPRKRRAAKAT